MLSKDFLVYSLLLAVGLGTAYYVSLPEETSSDEVSWVRIAPDAVTSLSFTGEGKVVQIQRQEGTEGGYWIQYSATRPAAESAEMIAFKANDKMADVLQWFNPLYAKRDVGNAQELDLIEFELNEDSGDLILSSENTKLLHLQVGKRAYGSRNYFVLDKSKNRVLLVSGSQIDNILNADTRLVERNLTGIDLDEVTKVELNAGDGSKTLDHTKKDGAGSLIWTDPGKSEEIPSYKSLMTKLSKLRVREYATVDEQHTLAALIPFAELTVYKGRNEVVSLRFLKETDTEVRYWVWSSFLGAFAEVDRSQVESLENDIPAILLD